MVRFDALGMDNRAVDGCRKRRFERRPRRFHPCFEDCFDGRVDGVHMGCDGCLAGCNRHTAYQPHVTFDESFVGQHRLGSGSAVPAMDAIDGQGRTARNPVVERYVGWSIELGHAHARHYSRQIEGQCVQRRSFTGSDGGDLLHDPGDGDIAAGVLHGRQQMHQLPQRLRCDPAPIARVQVRVGTAGM